MWYLLLRSNVISHLILLLSSNVISHLIFEDWYLEQNIPQVSVTELHWWQINITSDDGLVPSGNKPLYMKQYWFNSIMSLELSLQGPKCFNSLWPCDSIWWHRSLSTLAQVMACCLMAPSHYPYQCWLVVIKVLWHSSEGNYTRDTSSINHCKKLENDLSKISYKFPWGQWVKIYEHFTVTPGHSHQNLPLIMQGWTWWNKSVLHSHDSKTHIAIIWCNFQTGIMTDILSISCSPVNVIGPCRWKVNIGSGNGWVPLLCRQKAINWVKADRDLWHQMGLLTWP